MRGRRFESPVNLLPWHLKSSNELACVVGIITLCRASSVGSGDLDGTPGTDFMHGGENVTGRSDEITATCLTSRDFPCNSSGGVGPSRVRGCEFEYHRNLLCDS